MARVVEEVIRHRLGVERIRRSIVEGREDVANVSDEGLLKKKSKKIRRNPTTTDKNNRRHTH